MVYARNPSWTLQQVRVQVLTTGRRLTSLVGTCATGAVVNAAAALGISVPPPAPANNNCAGATPVTYGNTAFNTILATNDGPAACGGIGNDVWYRFTACATGAVTVRTCTLATFDTAMAVYTGSCAALTEVACNDDACGLQSSITFNATNATSYLIRVGGFFGAAGPGSFTISGPICVSVTPSDLCIPAPSIGSGTFTGSTASATNDGSASCGSSATSRDVWYAYTATCNGVLTLDTCSGTAFDTVLSVHTGCPGSASNQIGCNDDGQHCGRQSRLVVNVTAGTHYRIRVAGYNGAYGAFTLNVSGCIGPTGGPGGLPCPCDWDSDGTLNSVDFFTFLSEFMAGAADFNQSGDTSSQDLFEFLNCFIAAPGSCT